MSSVLPLLTPTRESGTHSVADAADSDTARALDDVAAQAAAGHYSNGLRIIRRALRTAPNDHRLIAAGGSILFERGRIREARAELKRAVDAGADSPVFFTQLGWSCLWMGACDEAEHWMRRAVASDSDNWKFHFGLGSALRAQRRFDDAVACFEAVLVRAPDNAGSLAEIVGCMVDARRFDEALAIANQAFAAYPSDIAVMSRLAQVLLWQDRFADAGAIFDRIVASNVAQEGSSHIPIDAGFAMREGARVDDALAFYEQYLPTHPDPNAHANYSFALLKAGRLRQGFAQYEFRWMIEPLRSLRPRFGKPVWSGQSLSGKTLLVLGEQGFGDFIQFVRYLPLVKSQGARIVVLMRKSLRELVERIPSVDQLLELGDPLPEFDYYINLLSLPHVLGTELDTVPVNVPYIDADPDRVTRWQRRIAIGEGLNVGIVWAGDPNGLRGSQKSIALPLLAPLASIPGVRLYSLQKGEAAAEAAHAPREMGLTDLSADIQDFADTAAIISSLDLVISVCTSVAHLAGAMGKPVWTLLPEPADWRWLEGREDTPWYPTMRLFRQPRQGDWASVITCVMQALESKASAVGRGIAKVARDTQKQVAPRLHREGTSIPPTIAGLCSAVEARHGIFQYRPEHTPSERSIAWYGEYLQPELHALAPLIMPGATVLEAGSGIGAHTIFLASRIGETGHILACEPRSAVRMILQQNLRANGVVNATTIDSNLLGRGANAGTDENDSIDDLCLQRLDWLKIGHEMDAARILSGAVETIWELRPHLFVAVTDEEMMYQVAERIRDFGYHCCRIDTPLFDPSNFNNRSDDIFDGSAAIAVIAIAEESRDVAALNSFTVIDQA